MEDKRNLNTRIMTSFIIVPAALVFIFVTNPFISIPLYLLGVGVMAKELFNLGGSVDVKNRCEDNSQTIIFAIIIIGSAFMAYQQVGSEFPLDAESIVLIQMLIGFLTLSFLYIFFNRNLDHCFKNQQFYLFVIFYLGFVFFHIFKLKYFFSKEELWGDLSEFYLLLAVMICWVFDSSAYLFGRKWGNKKIGLTVSIQKSWVGLIAGILSTFLAGALVSSLLSWLYPELWKKSFFAEKYLPWLIYPILGLVAQMGDLIASLHKRSSGVKDTGNFLKGHGGFYDRNDSLILVSVFLYYFLLFYHR